MIKRIVLFIILVTVAGVFHAIGQTLVLNGNVNCYHNNNNRQSRGAESVIISGEGGVFTFSASNTGYYHLDLQRDYDKCLYKNVRVFFLTRNRAYSTSKIVFITPDKIRKDNANPGQVYFSVGKNALPHACDQIEIPAEKLTVYIDSLKKREEEDYEGNDGYSSAVTILQNFAIIGGAAAGPPDSIVTYYKPVVYAEKTQIRNTILFKDAPFLLSGNTGFNFAPARDMSESMLWNAAAMTSSNRSLVAAYTNLANYGRLAALLVLDKNTSLGFGAATLRQSQLRQVVLDSVKTTDHRFTSGATCLQLSAGRKLTRAFSIGASVKYIKQSISYPSKIEVTEKYHRGMWSSNSYKLITDKIDTSSYDIDLSLHWRVLRSLSVGINLGNLLNRPLIQESNDSVLTFETIRARYAGLGLNFEHGRWNVGVDMQYCATEFILGLGASYTFSNDFRANISYVPVWKALAIQMKFKHFSVAYLDNFIVSETFPRFAFNRRRFYSGFSWSF